IAKTSTLPHESTSRVTSLAVDEGSMQQRLDELMALCTSLQRQHSEMVSWFEAQELEINSLKARIKLLENKDIGVADQSRDDALIKGRRLDVGEEEAERVSDDTEEMATEVEINRLKARVKLLEEREGLASKSSRDDASINGRSMDEREAATERVSDDTEEMATVLTSM
nr:hypothetical protein [Tanacetum cinerariifolium]